jgi:hypothetical protein
MEQGGVDDEGKPMSRTELAMLWDLLGRWQASHQTGQGLGTARRSAANLQILLDVELAERFGG